MRTKNSSKASSLKKRLRSPDSRPQAGAQWGNWVLVEFIDDTFGLEYYRGNTERSSRPLVQIRLDEATTAAERESWLLRAVSKDAELKDLIRAFMEIFPSSFARESHLQR